MSTEVCIHSFRFSISRIVFKHNESLLYTFHVLLVASLMCKIYICNKKERNSFAFNPSELIFYNKPIISSISN